MGIKHCEQKNMMNNQYIALDFEGGGRVLLKEFFYLS
jgi:hypothetical protein